MIIVSKTIFDNHYNKYEERFVELVMEEDNSSTVEDLF